MCRLSVTDVWPRPLNWPTNRNRRRVFIPTLPTDVSDDCEEVFVHFTAQEGGSEWLDGS